MADGYLEKRYEEVFGKGAKKTVVKHTSLESLMEKNIAATTKALW